MGFGTQKDSLFCSSFHAIVKTCYCQFLIKRLFHFRNGWLRACSQVILLLGTQLSICSIKLAACLTSLSYHIQKWSVKFCHLNGFGLTYRIARPFDDFLEVPLGHSIKLMYLFNC